jgi:hypothetical protein
MSTATTHARSSRNGQVPAEARPVTVAEGDMVLTDVRVERSARRPALLVSFAEGGEEHIFIVEAGKRTEAGNATYLLRTSRNWSCRIVEVVMGIPHDKCSCGAHGRSGRCHHTAIITHLLHTEQLPE